MTLLKAHVILQRWSFGNVSVFCRIKLEIAAEFVSNIELIVSFSLIGREKKNVAECSFLLAPGARITKLRKVKLIVILFGLEKSIQCQIVVGEINQNVFLIQIDASSVAEFELSEYEISRFNCISSAEGNRT